MKYARILIATAALAFAGAVLADPAPATATAPAAPSAGNTTAATAPPAVKPAHDPDQIICHTIVPVGSRLGGERTCMTRRQWDQVARDSKEAIDRQTNRSDQHNMKGS